MHADAPLTVYIHVMQGPDELVVFLADRLVSQALDAQETARSHAAEALLSTYNTSWRQQPGELSAQSFIEHLVLQGLSVGPDTSVTLDFADGGLFAGHSVLVTLDDRLRLLDAQIAG